MPYTVYRMIGAVVGEVQPARRRHVGSSSIALLISVAAPGPRRLQREVGPLPTGGA